MKRIVTAICAMISFLCIHAQETKFTIVDHQSRKDEAAIKTTFMASRIPDNWFISLGVGAADLMSEESRYVPFTDRVKPMFALSLGKWLSPVWGLRLNVTSSKLQGYAGWTYDPNNAANVDHSLGTWYAGTNHPIPGQLGTNSFIDVYDDPMKASFIRQIYMDKPRSTDKYPRHADGSEGGYEYYLNYVGASLDFLLNMHNVFSPYKRDRSFELILIAGLAYTHTLAESGYNVDLSAFTNPATGLPYDNITRGRTAVNLIGMKAAIQPRFRLNDSWNLFLEGQLYIMPESFDRRMGDANTMDGIANYMLGITYNIGKKPDFEEPELMDQVLIGRLNDKINELQSRPVPKDNAPELNALRNKLADLERQLKDCPKEIAKEKLKVVIHFLIDKHNVRPSEMYKLEEIAAFMQKYPQVKVSVSGYADVKTAYPEYNLKLSDRRAREVVRILTSKFSIDQNRFEVKAFGDTVQPFEVNSLNRAVIAFDIE